MAKVVDELKVKLTAKLTVDDDTAYACLKLIELYCRDNGYCIGQRHFKMEDAEDYEINLEFKKDEKIVCNEQYTN